VTRVFHLAWHDLRSQRLPLALFLAVLGVEFAMVWVAPDPGRRLTVAPVMPVIRLLFASLLTALIVHRDPLVGTTAFWQTRPIAGPLLMAGKATSLGLGLIVVPSLVMGAAWWNTGLWFSDAVELAGVTAVEHAVVVVLSAMAAVVTPTLTHLVVAGVAGTTLVTVINGILLPAIVNTWPFVGLSAGATRPVVYLGILLPLGAAAVVHQYLTRREWRTAALVGVALLAASGGARMWPPSGSDIPETPVNRAAIDPSAVVIRTLPETVTRTEQSRRAKGAVVPYARYAAVLTASGNPAAVFLELNRIDSRLILGNRTVVSEQGRWGVLADASRDQAPGDVFRASLQAALLPAALPAPSPVPWRAQANPVQLVEMTVADEGRHLGERGILTMKAGLDARRFVIASSIQVRPGAVLRGPGLSLEVTHVAPGTSDLVTARLSRLQGFDSWLFLARTYFALRNAKRREAIVLNTGGTWGGLTGTAGILRLTAYRTTGTLNPWSTGNRVHGVVPPPDAAWMADAELLLLKAESVGTFTREFQTEIVVGK
jgi:hypothetical protein